MGQPYVVHVTYDDLKRLPDDGRRYEILEGQIYMSPSPTTRHQWTSGRLYLLLARWAAEKAGGKVFYAPMDVLLAYDTVVQPDLIWVSPDRVDVLVKDIIEGAPDLVVEILSPGTSERDRGIKMQVYARHGVREYWLVDTDARTVEMLSHREGTFTRHALVVAGTPAVSSLDPVLVVDAALIFES